MSDTTRAAKGRSLYADAWRRLLENRMALLCGIVVIVEAGLVSCSGWLSPFAPDDQELWIRAQPPGFTHPDVKGELLFEVGNPADLPDRANRAARRTGVLDFTADRATTDELRVTINDGVVQEIVKGGREILLEIVVGTETGNRLYLEVLTEIAGHGAIVREARIATGEEAPDWLENTSGRKRWSAILALADPHPASVQITVDADGIVTGIREDDLELSEVRLRGHEVEKLLDGEGNPVVHTHPLGTDAIGRDLYSRILFGGWISLMVGIVATLVSLAIGVLYGAISGYFGGKVDTFLMAVVDILYAVPYMFLVILLLVMFGRNILMLFVALGCVQWLTMARIVRGQVLSLKQKEFIEAARTSGARHGSIIMRHLIPNTLGIIVVYTTLTIPAVILQEAFLAFIGLTVEYQGKAIESWGAMVNAGRLALGPDGQNWWLLVFPAFSLALMLFSLNFLGDGLRDAFDPKMKGKK